jgi:hypothetical protein
MSRKKDEDKLSPAHGAFESAEKDEVQEAIEQLQSVGAGPKVRFKIYRRPAGSRTWGLWRVVDRDSVDSIEEYCRGEGGRSWDYRYVYVGEDNRRVKDTKGKFLPHGNVWAEETAHADTSAATAAPEDEIFKQKEKELIDIARRNAQRSREIELKRETAEIERKAEMAKRGGRTERVESMDDRLDDDDGMLHGSEDDLPPFPIRMPMGPRMRRPFHYPYYQHQPEPRENNSNEVMLAMMNQNTQIIIAALSHQNKSSDDGILKILPLIMAGQMKPQDYIGTIMPMMGEAMKLQGEGARHAMESMGEMQKSMFNQIVKAMLAEGRPDDEIDKVKRIAGMVTEGVQDLVKIGLGRDSILKPGQEMKVPVLKQGAPNVPKPQQNSPPANKITEPVNGSVTHPEQKTSLPPPPPPPTEQDIHDAIKTNVRIFLIAHERQMLLNNDPTLLIEDEGFEKLMRSLPITLQESLETLAVADIYEELKKYDPEMVDRILKAASSNEKMMSWCQDFWTAFQGEEEEAPEPTTTNQE